MSGGSQGHRAGRRAEGHGAGLGGRAAREVQEGKPSLSDGRRPYRGRLLGIYTAKKSGFS